MKARPVLFVGSSTEGLPIAEALHRCLDFCCEVEIWSQGVFGLSQGSLESLVLALDSFDFAVLVLSADDLVMKRGEAVAAPRDNVLFELGLFTGGLGRERTYMLYDRTKPLALPSDLAGVTAATFEPHSSGKLEAALDAAVTKISQHIQRLGFRERRGSRRAVHLSLGVNLGWLQQGAEFGGYPISSMTADLERVRAHASDAGYQVTDLIASAQNKLDATQRAESILDVVNHLVATLLEQAEDIGAAALRLGFALGRLQQGAMGNNLPISLATSILESSRAQASKARYQSYNGFVDIALSKLSSGQPASSISHEVTHLIGLFQGQC